MERLNVKVVVFSVSFWGENEPKRLIPWLNCIDKNLKYSELFLSCGSYSNPIKLPIALETVQIGIKNTKPYNKNWCYYYVGFMTGIYHALLTKDFDVLVHIQNRTFIGMDLNPIVEEFMNRDEILAAPKFSSQIGSSIETGIMLMKREAVELYATSNLRCALSDHEQLNVEEEAFSMFGPRWWNFLPSVVTTRKNDSTYKYNETPFNLPDDIFYDLPIIAGPPHCSESEFNKWLELHNK